MINQCVNVNDWTLFRSGQVSHTTICILESLIGHGHCTTVVVFGLILLLLALLQCSPSCCHSTERCLFATRFTVVLLCCEEGSTTTMLDLMAGQKVSPIVWFFFFFWTYSSSSAAEAFCSGSGWRSVDTLCQSFVASCNPLAEGTLKSAVNWNLSVVTVWTKKQFWYASPIFLSTGAFSFPGYFSLAQVRDQRRFLWRSSRQLRAIQFHGAIWPRGVYMLLIVITCLTRICIQ